MEPAPNAAAWSSMTPLQQHEFQQYQQYAATYGQLSAVSNS
jgi:hypothetical protein